MTLKHNEDSSHFISLSDIMTALMLVFMFLSVAIINLINMNSKSANELQKMKQEYDLIDESLYKSLDETFNSEERKKLGIKVNKGTVSFDDPNITFNTGKSELKSEFKEKLAGFFPKYVNLIKGMKENIQEVRIEGYADSTGIRGETNQVKNYFYNMKLSQDRARNVLEYCLDLPSTNTSDFNMLKEIITANGLSSSKLKLDKASNKENKSASRRVEFQIITKTNQKMIERISGVF